MALTLPRWIAAAIAGVLILAAVFLKAPPPPRPEPAAVRRRRDLVDREHAASAAAFDAARQLRALELRDSIVPALSRGRLPDSSRFVVSAAVPPVAAVVAHVLSSRTTTIRSQTVRAPIDIAMVLDTLSGLRGRPLELRVISVTHVLPPVSGGRCLVIGRVQHTRSWFGDRGYWTRSLTSAEFAGRLLGPCAFYEAFGAPGPQIDRWLANGAWRFAASGALKRRPESFDFNPTWRMPMWGQAAGWPLRNYATTLGFRCTTGDSAMCLRLVLDPNSDPERRYSTRVRADRVVETRSDADNVYGTSLGPLEAAFLADMARSIGPDQFRRFWTSDKAPGEAFQSATGAEMGDWTAAWARQTYGRVQRGPGTDPSTIAWAGFIALLGFAGAIVAARRRQVA